MRRRVAELKTHAQGASLTAWWLRVCPLLQGAQGSIPDGGTKILHVVSPGKKKKKKEKKKHAQSSVCKQSPWPSHGREEGKGTRVRVTR